MKTRLQSMLVGGIVGFAYWVFLYLVVYFKIGIDSSSAFNSIGLFNGLPIVLVQVWNSFVPPPTAHSYEYRLLMDFLKPAIANVLVGAVMGLLVGLWKKPFTRSFVLYTLLSHILLGTLVAAFLTLGWMFVPDSWSRFID